MIKSNFKINKKKVAIFVLIIVVVLVLVAGYFLLRQFLPLGEKRGEMAPKEIYLESPKIIELSLPETIGQLTGRVSELGDEFLLIIPGQPYTEKVFPDEVKVLIDENTIIKKIVQKTENSWGPVEATFEDIRKDDRVIIKSEENIKGKDVFTASEITVSASVEPSE